MEYEKAIIKCKEQYPFRDWENYVLEQYTPHNCNRVKRVFDDLVGKLVMLGKDAEEAEKVQCFEYAVKSLNIINDETNVIETGERDQLCDLLDNLTIAVGLEPKDYGCGEGIADEWRDW